MHDSKIDITLVDFTAPGAVTDFVSTLFEKGIALGMTAPEFTPTRETNEIRQIANRIIRKLDVEMPKMQPSDAFKVIYAYDLAHRFAYLAPAPPSILNKYILAAFEAMINGDTEVDKYQMYQAVSQGLSRRDISYFGKPLDWLTITLHSWYKEAKQGFQNIELSDYDKSQRIKILLQTDLTPYEGANQSAFKHTLISIRV